MSLETPIPVTLLTGFLGSGKTTVLAQLVKHPDAGRIAAVINEFGDIDLDHDLIEASSEDTVLLGNGCLCCAIHGSLADTFRDLYARHAAGQYAFDRIVVETSGLADPTPVLTLMLSDEFLRTHFSVETVLVVADALHGEGQLDRHVESVRQAAVADRIVVSKSDIASPVGLASLKECLQDLNPDAEILTVVGGDIPPMKLLAPTRGNRGYATADGHDHVHARHGRGIGAASATRRHSLSEDEVAAVVEGLERLAGPNLLRAKGLLYRNGQRDPVAVHAVQHQIEIPQPVRVCAGEGHSRIVIIGQNLDRDQVVAALAPVFDFSVPVQAAAAPNTLEANSG